jgi:hypothetical protein
MERGKCFQQLVSRDLRAVDADDPVARLDRGRGNGEAEPELAPVMKTVLLDIFESP